MVADLVAVEIKSVDAIRPVFVAQMLTYLRATERHTGLILNFNVNYLRNASGASCCGMLQSRGADDDGSRPITTAKQRGAEAERRGEQAGVTCFMRPYSRTTSCPCFSCPRCAHVCGASLA